MTWGSLEFLENMSQSMNENFHERAFSFKPINVMQVV